MGTVLAWCSYIRYRVRPTGQGKLYWFAAGLLQGGSLLQHCSGLQDNGTAVHELEAVSALRHFSNASST